MPSLARIKGLKLIDPYILLLLGMVLLATILPCHGQAETVMKGVTNGAIAFLFFLYGGRLSREDIVAGITHWRLQLLVLFSTFVLFPALGLLIGYGANAVLSHELQLGLVFLSLLPSTVQSSIAFTSIARGNVSAAVCSASLSNLVGIFITPLLVSLFLSTQGVTISLKAVGDIVIQLLLPFIAGQLLRPWIHGFLQRYRRILGFVDRGSILLIVYVAFSESVGMGIWQRLDAKTLVVLLVLCAVLLACVLAATAFLSRRLGFDRADEIAIVFCGSKKSLATGIPMANILFAGTSIGLIVLPLMLFHQIQLMACAVIAQRYAANADTKSDAVDQAAF